MRRTSAVLAVLAALVLMLSGLSGYEYTMLGEQRTTGVSATQNAPEVVTSTTTLTTGLSTVAATATTTVTAMYPSALPPDARCCLTIGATSFEYTELNGTAPPALYALDNVTSFTFDGVRFSIIESPEAGAQHGAECYLFPPTEGGYLAVTFSDGTTERLNPCVMEGVQGMLVEVTSHVSPQAGFLVADTGEFYFLVSTGE